MHTRTRTRALKHTHPPFSRRMRYSASASFSYAPMTKAVAASCSASGPSTFAAPPPGPPSPTCCSSCRRRGFHNCRHHLHSHHHACKPNCHTVLRSAQPTRCQHFHDTTRSPSSEITNAPDLGWLHAPCSGVQGHCSRAMQCDRPGIHPPAADGGGHGSLNALHGSPNTSAWQSQHTA